MDTVRETGPPSADDPPRTFEPHVAHEGSRPIFSISAVAKIIGVPVATLRTWEERYGIVVPERTAGRHRLYTREQIEQLHFVKARVNTGVSAADAHRLLRERIDHMEPLTPRPRGDRGRLLILLTEHDPYAAEFEEYFLKTEGYQVELAPDADSARAALERASPSLVVIDLLISGGLGLELCRWLKGREDPPLVLTVSTLELRDDALEAGADAFLMKPLDRLQFISTVMDLLRSSAFLAEGGTP